MTIKEVRNAAYFATQDKNFFDALQNPDKKTIDSIHEGYPGLSEDDLSAFLGAARLSQSNINTFLDLVDNYVSETYNEHLNLESNI